MRWWGRLLGKDRTISGRVVVAAAFVAFGAHLLVTALEPTQPAPGPVLDTVLARFLWIVIPLLAAVGYAYWNDGWLVTVAVLYIGLTSRPLSPMYFYSHVNTYSPLVERMLMWLPLSLLWGTGCYLVGVTLKYVVIRVHQPVETRG